MITVKNSIKRSATEREKFTYRKYPKKINNSIYILGSRHIPGMYERLKEFQQYNPAIEVMLLDKGLYVPQWEYPEEVLNGIEMFLS